MRVLALETATLAGSAALLEGDRVVGSSLLDIEVTHSERLMAMVDRLLVDCRWGVSELDGLAVSIGPGSFTGLRIGVATVKGLALALGRPVAAVPTLDALAANLPFAVVPVCPLLDARKGEVYLALYEWTGDRMERSSDYLALAPRAAVDRLTPPVIVLGDGVAACRPFLAERGPGIRIAPSPAGTPSAAVVGRLGHAMLEAGQIVDADALAPMYVRPSEAELGARRG
jgi:tRNA threonylcarbamoyladenosine biosynthesis protein TsaB